MDINFATKQYAMYKEGQRYCSSPFPFGPYTSPPGIAFVSGNTVTRFDDIVIRGGSGSGSSGSAVESSEFVAAFDGGSVTSDAGLLLMRRLDQRLPLFDLVRATDPLGLFTLRVPGPPPSLGPGNAPQSSIRTRGRSNRSERA